MLARIKRLQLAAEILEPNSKQRINLAKKVEEFNQTFLDQLIANAAYHPDHISQKISRLLSIREKPIAIADILSLINSYVTYPGLNISAPGFLGYIPGSGLYSAALGDYIAAITNRFAGVSYISPGAARIENILIRWMCHLVGYSKSAGGNLSSGGSLANFIGIVAARQAFNVKSCDYQRLVIYLSSQTHHSLFKALRLAGLQEAHVRIIPVDKNFRVNCRFLEQCIKDDRKKKLFPWLLIANAGTTNTGSIDSIAEMSELAKRYRLWLHVDAAYGGFFLLCASVRKYFEGVNHSDSITIDPHKGLFIPYGLGVILTRETNALLRTYRSYEVDYLSEIEDDHLELSPANLSPELSKHFRGLRMWLPLKLHGLAPFRAALNEKLLLAKYFYQNIRSIKGMEIACQPQLSIVTFHYHPPRGDANLFNKQLAENIKHNGRIYFSTTWLDHKLYLRMACLNYRTHLNTIELAIDEIKRGINTLRT